MSNDAVIITGENLAEAIRIVRAELPKHLSNQFVVDDVRAESLPGPDDEDYIHVNVIMEDGHPEMDIPRLVEFNRVIRPLFESAGIKPVTPISYSNKSEIAG